MKTTINNKQTQHEVLPVMTKEHLKTLLNSEEITTIHKAFLSLQWNTGLRVNEVLQVWEHFHNFSKTNKGKMELAKLKTKDILLKSSVGTQKKVSIHSVINMLGTTFDYYIEAFTEQSPVTNGAITKWFAKFSIILDTRMASHGVRRGSAWFLYTTSNDLLLVKEFLNHENVETTLLYIDSIKLGFKRADMISLASEIMTKDS